MSLVVPHLEIAGMLLAGVVVGSVLHGLFRRGAALGLLCVATMLLAGYVTISMVESGPYLAMLLLTHFVALGLLPALAALTVTLAVLSSLVGVARARE